MDGVVEEGAVADDIFVGGEEALFGAYDESDDGGCPAAAGTVSAAVPTVFNLRRGGRHEEEKIRGGWEGAIPGRLGLT